MTDKFERHRLTRWVKADIPSYGDEWGNEYDEYEPGQDAENELQNQIEATSPTHLDSPRINAPGKPKIDADRPVHLVSNSTLVLSIDQPDFHAKVDESDASDTGPASEEDNFAENAKKTAFSGPSETILDTHIAKDKSPRPLPMLQTKEKVHDSPGFLPPTPTYLSRPHFAPASPETDASDRSYMSDVDSIQREPASLNVWAPKDPPYANKDFPAHVSEDLSSASMSTGERSFIEPTKPKQTSPQALVLSIDQLNLGSSDDDDDDDDDDDSSFENYGNLTDHVGDRQIIHNSRTSDGSHTGSWGYNSNRNSSSSSNFEKKDASVTQLENTVSNQAQRHRVKTDALDSLIDDLSKMEGDAAFFGASSAQTLKAEQPFTASGNLEYHTTRESKGLLPTLDSIHDLKLPDFNERSFSNDEAEDAGSRVAGFILPEDNASLRDEDHQKFMSSVRQDSIRKPPSAPSTEHDPLLLNVTLQKPIAGSISAGSCPDIPPLYQTKPESVSFRQQNKSKVNNFPVPGTKAPELVPPPISKDALDIGRRDSTISTSTFNLGSWKPNTSIYRDQFVKDNDNESQMNISIYAKDESAYKKFTRTGPVSTYAPSITNSSCVSVPDTVDTSLQKINEDHLDEDYPDTISVAKSYQPVTPLGSSDHSLGSSVLYDHDYKKPTFHEESHTPVTATDDLEPIHEEAEPRITTAGSSDTIKTISVADLETSISLPKKFKYPDSNWKKIMATSQPADRIELLKKARIDEMNFDTGLSQWLRESLKSTGSTHIQIGQLATQAYKNAQHSDIRRHTSIRSKVNLVRDKIEPGHLGMQASSFGRKFLSRGKKLMKQSSD